MAKKVARKKTTARKAPARKKVTKKATRKVTKKAAKKTTKKATRAVAAHKPARITSADKPRTKSEIYSILADHAGISKKEVAAVFDTMGELISKDLSKRGPGVFNVPGMMKVLVQRKPSVPRRKGVNPFTGEEQWFKAKPARNVVKVRPLKGLKDKV